jgi:hypothetical protein
MQNDLKDKVPYPVPVWLSIDGLVWLRPATAPTAHALIVGRRYRAVCSSIAGGRCCTASRRCPPLGSSSVPRRRSGQEHAGRHARAVVAWTSCCVEQTAPVLAVARSRCEERPPQRAGRTSSGVSTADEGDSRAARIALPPVVKTKRVAGSRARGHDHGRCSGGRPLRGGAPRP